MKYRLTYQRRDFKRITIEEKDFKNKKEVNYYLSKINILGYAKIENITLNQKYYFG